MTPIEQLIELGKQADARGDGDRLSLEEACKLLGDYATALIAALPDLEAMRWRDVETEGLPEGESAIYDVAAIDYDNSMRATFAADYDHSGALAMWMDEDFDPLEGVYAWRPIAPKPTP